LLIEYEGTRYHGFQIQKDVPTIQGEVEKAIQKVTGEMIRLYGAGRTDAGVHAKGQVAAFETESTLSAEIFVKALNSYLSPDIAIKDACIVKASFDPRRDAVSREYRYTINNSTVRSPISRKWAYSVLKKLNIENMNAASEILLGEHDLAPFTNKEGATKNTVRMVTKAEFEQENEFLYFDMVSRAFLPQQVRRTVGSLLEVGSGKLEVSEFFEIACSGEIGRAKPVVPPHGLCLIKVNYSDIGFSYENI